MSTKSETWLCRPCLAVLTAGLLWLLFAATGCGDSGDSGDAGDGSASNPRSADEALCEELCRQSAQAGCDDCTPYCGVIVVSLGECLETWRALTECLVDIDVTCTAGKLYPNTHECDALLDQHAACLGPLADAGGG